MVVASYAQETFINLGDWVKEGRPNAGSWLLSEDSSTVLQTSDGGLTFFVGPETYINATFRGSLMLPLEGAGDDDFIGFTFGFKRPVGNEDYFDMYLFDWKAADQQLLGRNAREGFTLSYINGVVTDTANELASGYHAIWNHTDSNMTVLDSMYGDTLGWVAGHPYIYELSFDTNRIIISIDSAVIFDVSGVFEAGRFGFYNYTQRRVEYQLFSVNQAPTAVNDTITIYEDSIAVINVLANDFDTDNDTISIISVGNPTHGNSGLSTNDSMLIYSPYENYYGNDSFIYHISGEDGRSDYAIVHINILAVNDPPFLTENIPDVQVANDGQWYFHIKLNDYFADVDLNDALLDSFLVSSNGHISTLIVDDSLFLSSFENSETDTITVTAIDDSGAIAWTSFIATPTEVLSVKQAYPEIPVRFQLFQNYPNPFNPSTTINYHIASFSRVSLKIYDNLGREIRTLLNTAQNPGKYKISFDGSNLPSGIYFLKFNAGNFSETQRMLLIR
jgi:hypothetical protein